MSQGKGDRRAVSSIATRRVVSGVFCGALLAVLVSGCQEQTYPEPPLEIIGVYNDNFGCVDTVTETTFSQNNSVSCGGIFHISYYSNSGEYFIAQNDASNSFDPSLWSRFDWVTFQSHLYYCQTAFSAASESAALATPRADTSDPATTGCGGAFSWTQLD